MDMHLLPEFAGFVNTPHILIFAKLRYNSNLAQGRYRFRQIY